jgi:hypothetical protein
LIHRDDIRFVSTDTAQIADQAARTRLQDTNAIAYAKAKPKQKELDVAIGGVWAVLEIAEGDPVLTVLELRRARFCHKPVVASASPLRLAFLCFCVHRSRGDPKPLFSAALGLAAALGNLLRVGVLWCVCVLAFQ